MSQISRCYVMQGIIGNNQHLELDLKANAFHVAVVTHGHTKRWPLLLVSLHSEATIASRYLLREAPYGAHGNHSIVS